MNLYVGKLSYDMSEAELKDLFQEHGEITSVKIITDKFTGRSKGFGFIEMPNAAEATKAIKALNGSKVKGKEIIVNEAIERTERRSNFRGGGNRWDKR
jgi:RNA recognition motif-containing protein